MLFSRDANLVRRDLINQPSSTSLPLEVRRDRALAGVHHQNLSFGIGFQHRKCHGIM